MLLGIITAGSVSLSVVVGDWLYTETHTPWLAWTLAILNLLGFVGSYGIALGFFFVFRSQSDKTEYTIVDTMETIIQQIKSDDSLD